MGLGWPVLPVVLPEPVPDPDVELVPLPEPAPLPEMPIPLVPFLEPVPDGLKVLDEEATLLEPVDEAVGFLPAVDVEL